jgi:hypothetical protein
MWVVAVKKKYSPFPKIAEHEHLASIHRPSKQMWAIAHTTIWHFTLRYYNGSLVKLRKLSASSVFILHKFVFNSNSSIILQTMFALRVLS